MSERTTGQVQDMPRPSLSTLNKHHLKNGMKGLINIAFRGIELSLGRVVAILDTSNELLQASSEYFGNIQLL